ncbi:MAG: hydantoinase B/oxoprolinase family protein [Trueperaceae bacterium]|nr:hydantoinase B/oxoprolinase family protein [Trueperaceae bacterium]
MSANLDPFTAEVIKNSLVAIGEEMFVAMARTSMSPIIYEVLDYATGLTTAKAEILTQGNGVAGFIGVLTFSVKSVIDKFGLEGLKPGDIIMTNDPYGGGGTHTSDVCMVMPIFYKGEIIAFSANKAHWTEVGGMSPGSWTTDSTEIFQEGLQFPCIKAFENDKPLQQLIDLIRVNVRTPDMSIGDFYAQAASVRLAGKRMVELCDKYGAEAVKTAMAMLLDDGEVRAKQALASLPKGTFTAEDTVDDDGISDDPIPVKVKVTITDDEFIVDFSDMPPQVAGPINSSITGTNSALRCLWLAISNPKLQVNEGFFKPLRLIVPEGTIISAQRPAPTSTYWETLLYSLDLIWKALAPVVPHRLSAGHYNTVGAAITTTFHPDGDHFTIMVEPNMGGWGAQVDQDGESGLFCSMNGETFNLPVEITEHAHGLMVDEYCFNPDAGGEGKFRGGRGVIRAYKILHDNGGTVTITLGRHKFPAWGVDGGHKGGANRVEIKKADGSVAGPYGKTARKPLQKGDVLRIICGAGGGWGDPKDRSKEKVLADVKAGMMSKEVAKEIYGVDV